MLVPLSWLKTFLPKLPAPSALAEKLLMHGLEVENIVDRSTQFENVVVGEIVAIQPHPNADKLRLADVIFAPNGKSQTIVCGAPNIAVGQKVAVALIGATLPNGLTIEARAIRGVTSNGMICAEDELGLGQSQVGVLVLDSAFKVGTPFAVAMGFGDVVFDLAIPANRADLMSIRGLAREIAAITGTTAKFVPVKLSKEKTLEEASVTLNIADPKVCSILSAQVIRGVTSPLTPKDIVSRLQGAGMRSINIIVDITNYVMLEYGQPLHAYDAAKVTGATLTVRPANAAEELVTLDGRQRKLTPEMLVVSDVKNVIGLAGVMGGKDTEVTVTTTDIILEAAIFDRVLIRRTSRNLGLVSEASKRFERGLWVSLPAQASAAAAALIIKYCGGTLDEGIISIGKTTVKPVIVTINPKYISERLGKKVSAPTSKKILSKLGFVVKGTAARWDVKVPDWRLDVSLPEDIVDEVGRMVGYDELPKKMPTNTSGTKDIPATTRFREEVKNILVDAGLTEVISHAFYSLAGSDMAPGRHYEVANPLDKTQQYLRTSLVPQIMDVLKQEADAGHDAAVFEIGRVFDNSPGKDLVSQQPWKLALGIAQKPSESNPLEELIKKISEVLELKPDFHFPIEIAPAIRSRKPFKTEVLLSELMAASKKQFGPWDPKRHTTRNVTYREPSKYPPIKRDISAWVPDTTNYAEVSEIQDQIHSEFRKIADPLLESVESTAIQIKGRTSVTLYLVFRSTERTLTKPEIDATMSRLASALKKLGATIR